ncbi:MAG: hypothetical protein H6963_01380 [Chromatiaceae bacterium]|nr:hypothetical protein [Gammaproteobacteria bacterium]MCP5407932.1 hypothetical protein [Chromatiaceae bacterium]
MIFIDRNEVSEPVILTQIDQRDYKTETQRARDHYEDPNWNGKTSFDYKRYKHDDVKKALRELCHDKCAYCESDFAVVSHEDIEHWRPKGAVILANGTERKPGYYWLGANWNNLLPSCQHCNRRSRHKDARDPTIEQTGKQNLFPVADEAERWTNPDMPNGEQPLLLNPCEDHPEEYLFVDQNAVICEKRADGLWNQRAHESISIYGLNRVELVNDRLEHRSLVVALIEDLEWAIRCWHRSKDNNEREDHRQFIERKLVMLAKQRGNASPYLFMKRPLIDDCIMRIGPDLEHIGIEV